MREEHQGSDLLAIRLGLRKKEPGDRFNGGHVVFVGPPGAVDLTSARPDFARFEPEAAFVLGSSMLPLFALAPFAPLPPRAPDFENAFDAETATSGPKTYRVYRQSPALASIYVDDQQAGYIVGAIAKEREHDYYRNLRKLLLLHLGLR